MSFHGNSRPSDRTQQLHRASYKQCNSDSEKLLQWHVHLHADKLKQIWRIRKGMDGTVGSDGTVVVRACSCSNLQSMHIPNTLSSAYSEMCEQDAVLAGRGHAGLAGHHD